MLIVVIKKIISNMITRSLRFYKEHFNWLVVFEIIICYMRAVMVVFLQWNESIKTRYFFFFCMINAMIFINAIEFCHKTKITKIMAA